MQIYASELFVASCKVVCAAIARHPNPSQLWRPSSWPGVALIEIISTCCQISFWSQRVKLVANIWSCTFDNFHCLLPMEYGIVYLDVSQSGVSRIFKWVFASVCVLYLCFCVVRLVSIVCASYLSESGVCVRFRLMESAKKRCQSAGNTGPRGHLRTNNDKLSTNEH